MGFQNKSNLSYKLGFRVSVQTCTLLRDLMKKAIHSLDPSELILPYKHARAAMNRYQMQDVVLKLWTMISNLQWMMSFYIIF